MRLDIFVVGVLFAMTASAEEPAHFTILGEGGTICGEWIDLRKHEASVLPESAWVLGYITATSRQIFLAGGTNITYGLRGTAVDHWVDNYCAAHPLDIIQQSAQALADELVSRSKKSN